MEHVWDKIEGLRGHFEILEEDRTPIDVFTFFEIDIGLDAIPFDDLAAKYRVDAAIKVDFSGIYLDAEQYALMERGPEWKLNRLRFTVAHELAHYFLHRNLPQESDFKSLHDFARWTANNHGRKYTVEQEANEFTGRLLEAERLVPNFMTSGPLRDKFAEKIAPRFGVNSQVIAVRLDRDGLWTAS